MSTAFGSHRIDVHHHFFPSRAEKIKKNDEVGWKTPGENLPWSPVISLKAMDALGIEKAILSLPPNSSGVVSAQNRDIARKHNQFAANICRENHGRFGFFAGLPFLDDTAGCLKEIAYTLDELNADGIALTSSYGEGSNAVYVGDDRYDRIWEELNQRKALVFLHGAQTPSSAPFPHAFLGIPIVESPNETFKAAAHLVVTGRKRKYPDVKIILAHLGGTTPILAPRVAVLSHHMGCSLNPEEIMRDFQTFYYETALSGYDTNLAAMEKFVSPDRIIFGTDFPVSIDMAQWYTHNVETYYEGRREVEAAVMRGNILKLLTK